MKALESLRICACLPEPSLLDNPTPKSNVLAQLILNYCLFDLIPYVQSTIFQLKTYAAKFHAHLFRVGK